MPAFHKNIRIIIQALAEARYDPYDQLRGYAETGDLSFITRHNGARELAAQIDPARVREFLHSAEPRNPNLDTPHA